MGAVAGAVLMRHRLIMDTIGCLYLIDFVGVFSVISREFLVVVAVLYGMIYACEALTCLVSPKTSLC